MQDSDAVAVNVTSAATINQRFYNSSQSGGTTIQGDQNAGRDIINHFGKSDRQRLLRWLSRTPYSSHHQTIRKDVLVKSGTWLLENKKYTTWEASPVSTILWIHGIPGSGKSKLASTVIERLRSDIEIHNLPSDRVITKSCLAYFYCERSTSEADRSDPDNVMRCLLKQIAVSSASEPVHKTVLNEWARRRYEADESGLDEPTKLDISECVGLMLQVLSDRSAFVVLDAETSVKVFVSSRDESDIVCHLGLTPNVVIRPGDNNTDIKRFVLHQVEQAIAEKRLLKGNVSDRLKEQITTSLITRSHGMFRWVALQIQSLCNHQRVKHEEDIQIELQKLPRSLKQSYDLVYDQIMNSSDTTRFIATRALQWLLYAQRKLTTREFVSAISFNSQGRRIRVDAQDILDICSSFLTLDEELDTFRFAHMSVREYLESRPDYIELEIHTMILNSCLETYAAVLAHWEFRTVLPEAHRLFQNYATTSWALHFETIIQVSDHESIKGSSGRVSALLLSLWGDVSDRKPTDDPDPNPPTYESLSVHGAFSNQACSIRLVSDHIPTLKVSWERAPVVWRRGLPRLETRIKATHNLLNCGQDTLSMVSEVHGSSQSNDKASLREILSSIYRSLFRDAIPFYDESYHDTLTRIYLRLLDGNLALPFDLFGFYATANLSGFQPILRGNDLSVSWDPKKVNAFVEILDNAAKNNSMEIICLLSARTYNSFVLDTPETVKIRRLADSYLERTSNGVKETPPPIVALEAVLQTIDEFLCRISDDMCARTLGEAPHRQADISMLAYLFKIIEDRCTMLTNRYMNTLKPPNQYEYVLREPQNDYTPYLMIAAEVGHVDLLLDYLRTQSEALDIPDQSGRTPLSYAAGGGQEQIVRLLLFRAKGDVDVNRQDNDGHSPMWWAIHNGWESVAWILKSSSSLCREDKTLLRKQAPAWMAREKLVRHLFPTLHPGLAIAWSPSQTTFRRNSPKF